MYKIIVIFSETEKRHFESCWNYSSAATKYGKNKDKFRHVFKYSFDTLEERNAFIKGYQSRPVSRDDSIYFTNDPVRL